MTELEPKMQIELINVEINVLTEKIQLIKQTAMVYKSKIDVLKERKILLENYLSLAK